MPIPDPWTEPESTSAQQSNPDSTRAPAHEHAHAHAREAATESTESVETAGEVVAFPGTVAAPAADSDVTAPRNGFKAVVAVWATEARESATAAADGSVWRARPPSLRDIHTRTLRAEWAGDIPALRTAGRCFGYVSLTLTALGYALLWVARRPSRLVLTVLITVLVVVLAI